MVSYQRFFIWQLRSTGREKNMELGHGNAVSLSPCVCFVKNSGILTIWNQKEMKDLIIQNTIAKELCGFCFESIEERMCVLRKFTTAEKKKLLTWNRPLHEVRRVLFNSTDVSTFGKQNWIRTETQAQSRETNLILVAEASLKTRVPSPGVCWMW